MTTTTTDRETTTCVMHGVDYRTGDECGPECRRLTRAQVVEVEGEFPPDLDDLDQLPPDDVDVCDVCGGAGAIAPIGSVDPQLVETCPACGGGGIRGDYR